MTLEEVFKQSKDINPNMNYIKQLTENHYELHGALNNKTVEYIVEVEDGKIYLQFTKGI